MTAETLLLKEINIFPELFLGIALIYLVLHGTFLSMRNSYPLIQNSMIYLGSLVLILCFILILNEKLYVLDFVTMNNSISNDYSSFISKILITSLSLICLLIIQPYLNAKKLNQFEYVLLLLFSILGLFILCSSNDLITAYLAIELQTLAFYVLAAFNRNSTFSIDSGIKYFILGSLSSALFLFGASLIYGVSGTVNFSELKDLFINTQFVTEKELEENINDFCYVSLGNSLVNNQFHENVCYHLGSNYSDFSNLSLIKEDLSNFDSSLLIDQLCTLSMIEEKYRSLILGYQDAGHDFRGTDKYINSEVYSRHMIDVLFATYGFLNFLTFVTNSFGKIDGIQLKNVEYTDVTHFFDESFPYHQINTFSSLSLFNSELIAFALVFILISLFFKLAIVPFHSWAPDVYEGSPSSSTFFFSVVPKIAIFILSLRIFYYSFHSFFGTWFYLVSYTIVLSVLVGSFGGLEQRKLKSLLVYSSISHMGYSLIAFNSGSFDNLQILFCYLVVYSFSSLCIWSIFIFTRVKNNRLKKQNKDLTDLVALYKANYSLAGFFSIILFSVAGFPPMIGFLVKIKVFSTALESSMYFVALISILCSVIATFFYIRIVKIIYFEKIEVGKLYYPITTEKVFILAGLLWLSIFLFINPTLLFLISNKFSLLFSY